MARFPRGAKEVRGPRQWQALTPREQDTYERVLDAISLARREKLPLAEAAKRAGTSVGTIKVYAGSAVERRGRRLESAQADRVFRQMRMLTIDGQRVVGVRGSRVASRIAKHQASVDRYL